MLGKLFGKSGNQAEVSRQGSLHVTGWDAFMENALTKGDAYIWCSQDINIGAGGTMLIVRNDSHAQKLVIVRIEVTNGNVATRYEIHKVTAAYTADDDSATEINAGGWGKGAPATATADDDGNTQGTVFAEIGAGVAVETYARDIGMVLNQGEAIGVDQVTESTAGNVTLYGYFIDNEEIGG
ncbi:hypothetical protein LCGC14_2926910 [marine sediment metagenome]|uniref:Uncharacterized protein n=1 Tax=marine sediment metagenome TaxID=412755 RepID=A0A0F8XM49_9ZZZZ